MLERAFQYIGDDLHVAVRVRRKSRAGRDAIVIDDPQGTEPHVVGVVVVPEREGVAALEPAQFGLPAVLGFAIAATLVLFIPTQRKATKGAA